MQFIFSEALSQEDERFLHAYAKKAGVSVDELVSVILIEWFEENGHLISDDPQVMQKYAEKREKVYSKLRDELTATV